MLFSGQMTSQENMVETLKSFIFKIHRVKFSVWPNTCLFGQKLTLAPAGICFTGGGNIVNSPISALRSISSNGSRRVNTNYGTHGRGFSGRSPMTRDNDYRYQNNRDYENRYRNNMNEGQSNSNRRMGDNTTPWSWNPNNGNRPYNKIKQ